MAKEISTMKMFLALEKLSGELQAKGNRPAVKAIAEFMDHPESVARLAAILSVK